MANKEEKALRKLAGKMPLAAIARKLKRSITSVERKAGRMAIPLAHTVRSLPPEEQPTPAEESQGKTIARLAKELSTHRKREGDYSVLSEKLGDFAKKMPVPKRLKLKGRPADKDQEMVALFSDSHSCETWTRDQTDGLSEYNFEAFCRYIWGYADMIVGFAKDFRGRYGVRKLHVDFLGDIYHGSLRLDDEATNEYGTVKGVAMTSSVIFQWLLLLLEHFETIDARCMAGNHGRLHQKPQSKRYVGENLDTLIYSNIKLMTKAAGLADRVKIDIPDSRTHTFSRLGHRIKIGHGDHIRGGNSIANIPIYGISRDILRKYRQEFAREGRREGLALVEYGHFHNCNFIEDILFMNGSIVPADPYATDDLGAVSQQKQWVYFTSKKHAFGWTMPVSLKGSADTPHGFAVDG